MHQPRGEVSSKPQSTSRYQTFFVLQNCRNLVGALLLSACSFSLAQDKPHGLSEDQHLGNAGEEQSVLISDPTPNMVWHKSLDADISSRHMGTRGEVDEGMYGSVGGHWGEDNYSLAFHYLENLSPDTPFQGHAVENEMELRFLLLRQPTPNTQLQFGLWAFTEKPLESHDEKSGHTTEQHDSHDSEQLEHEKNPLDLGGHERITIISPTIGLQHEFSRKLRMLLTGSVGLDTEGSLHSLSSLEFLGTVFQTDRVGLIYNAGFNYAIGIGTSLEGSTGIVFSNRAHTGKLYIVGDGNHNFDTGESAFGGRIGISVKLERGHH